MTQGVTVTTDMTLLLDAAHRLASASNQGLAATQAFPGFHSVQIVRHQNDPCRFLFIQRWVSRDAYQNYIDWRTARGELDALQSTATRVETNVWPVTVAAASALP